MADKQPNLIKFQDFIPAKTIRFSKKSIESKDYNFKRIPITDKDGNDIYLTTHVGYPPYLLFAFSLFAKISIIFLFLPYFFTDSGSYGLLFA